jgi:DNA polymerase-3 subunit alpha
LIKVGALSSFGNRASLLESMDEIRNKVTKPKSLKGQQGLFSSKEIAKKAASSISVFEQIPEFGEEELETLERELLGFSLSARPIHELLGDLSHAASHKIEELDSQKDTKKPVKVACIVSEVRIVITKKSGQEMAFAKVSDGTGTLNLVVFPSIYQETKSLWMDKSPVVVTGKVDFREDVTSLIVDKISTKADLANFPKSTKKEEVYISIPKNSDPEALKRLKTLLLKNKGGKKATLVFEGKNKKLKLPFGINWNKSLAFDIKDLLDAKEN